MIRRLIPSSILIFFLVFGGISPAAQDTALARFDEARRLWDLGDFVPALDEFEAILKSPDGGRFFDNIALITGELFRVNEIAKDGRNIRVSSDGRYVAFETGPRTATLTRVLLLNSPDKVVAEVAGTNFVFSSAPHVAAYLRIGKNREIAKLRKDIEELAAQESPDRAALMARQRQLAWLEAKAGEIVLIDLAANKEKILKTEGLLKGALTFSANGREIYFVGANETDAASNEIYAISDKNAARPLTTKGQGFKTAPIAVPGGKYMIYTPPAQTPFPKPQPPAAGQPQAQAGAAPAAKPAAQNPPTGGQMRPGGARSFVIMNLVDSSSKPFTGSSPAISADGSTLVFTGQEGTETTLNVVKLEGQLTPAVIKKTQERIGSTAMAPDGSGIVFDMTYTRNSEIFYIHSDGKGEIRLSREIEPDRAPRFLNKDLVLAVKGEPRHSRSHIYDLKTLANFRLFDNNSLRTITPEYEWAADPSGMKVLVGAERDGDTISPERGVYIVDLAKKISMENLSARIQFNRNAEKILRARGEKTFAPIHDAVKAAADGVSTTKIYDYEEALFNFDSKYISMPGNKLAADYIFNQLKSFGYEPEYQTFETRGIKTANVLARHAGTENPEIIYILSGHFDSNQRGPGADDNSSVTAVNLEAARILADVPLPATVIFAFFTGEEAGLLGSREFVRQAQEKKWLIAADLNNDMIGWANDHLLDDTIRYSNAGIRDIQHAAAFLFSKMVTHDTRYVKSTDAVSFYEAYGDIVGGLGSYPVLGNPYYHQPTDLLETVNHQLLTEAAKYNIAAIMMLASSPMPVKGLKIENLKSGSADITWTSSPEKSVVAYRMEFGPEKSPTIFTTEIKQPFVKLTGLKIGKGEKLTMAVKALTNRGLSSWDWTRTSAPASK
jgi:hypothetical protein